MKWGSGYFSLKKYFLKKCSLLVTVFFFKPCSNASDKAQLRLGWIHFNIRPRNNLFLTYFILSKDLSLLIIWDDFDVNVSITATNSHELTTFPFLSGHILYFVLHIRNLKCTKFRMGNWAFNVLFHVVLS